jgi:hypothetical protein
VLLALYAYVVPLLSYHILRSTRKTIKAELAMADWKSLGLAPYFAGKTKRSHKSNSSERR